MSVENGNPEKGYSAFISHASADREAANAIAASLEAKGLTCWIAPRDVRPGAEYPAESSGPNASFCSYPGLRTRRCMCGVSWSEAHPHQ